MNNYGFGAGLNNSLVSNPVIGGSRVSRGYQTNELNNASDIVGNNNMDWNEGNWLSNLISLANNGDVAAQEKLINYYIGLQGDQRAFEREDTAYQRLMVDLKKAGISPYIISGSLPGASNSSLQSFSGSQMVSQQSNKISSITSRMNKEAEINKGVLIGLLAFFGLVLKAVL